MTMSKLQVAHLQARIDNAVQTKIEAAAKKLPPRPDLPKLTPTQMYAKIADGSAKLKPFRAISGYVELYEAYTYPKHEAARADQAKWDAQLQKIAQPIRNHAQRIIDGAILGDGKAALEMLIRFEKGDL